MPPHERAWRHPAEVHQANRQRFATESAPPPVSRRTSSIVVLLALAAGAAVVAVTVPKGLDERAEPVAADVATTTAVPTKGAGMPVAVAIADGWYAVAAEDVSTELHAGETLPVSDSSGNGLTAVVRWHVPELGIVILSGESSGDLPFADEYDDNEVRYLLGARSLTVVDRSGTTHEVESSVLTDAEQPAVIPVNVTSRIDRLGVLLGLDNHAIGLVSHVDYRDKVVLFPHLADVITDVIAGG